MMGISEATFHNWKKKYRILGVNELRRLKQFKKKKGKMKQLVANFSLE